ncbi:MAG: M18 family aminopeptidase [Firmicutes bacterium]|nr:M18 family aminopeptidase [Bacillota bacterium]
MSDTNKELLEFIQASPSVFHCVQTLSDRLEAEGFVKIGERKHWDIEKGGRYYLRRNGSSLIAFKVGKDIEESRFQFSAAHCDSPTFKIKEHAELSGPDDYLRLDVEAYGGMIDSTWFDKPLGIAGRVFVYDHEQGKVFSHLLELKNILIIPNVPIHFNRDVNKGYAYNRAVDLCPLFSAGELKKGDFDKMIADELGVPEEDIVGRDLFLVNNQEPMVWGRKNEFVSSPKLDDLQCVFSSFKGFLEGNNEKNINVFVCFDNEEVGSNTMQGAMSTFLVDTAKRISMALGGTEEQFYMGVAKSFMISADNAPALHPNHTEYYDAANRVYMNKGIVAKENATQKYVSDGYSKAVLKEICKKADVPMQYFSNRSDIAGGGTLGNLSNTQISLHGVDIGLPQLAMHSSYETAGALDTEYAVQMFKTYFSTEVVIHDPLGFVLR